MVSSLATACALGGNSDDEPAGPFGKADSPYADSAFHECARASALQLVNDPSSDSATLIGAGLTAVAATRVLSARPVASVQALELVPGVGLENVRALLRSVGAQCAGYSFPRPCEIMIDRDADGVSDQRTAMTYDERGRNVRYERWIDGTLQRVFARTYDQLGNYVRLEQYRADASGQLSLAYVSQRTYDDRGRKTRELEDKTGDGQWQLQHDWTYGEHAQALTYAGRRYGADNPGTTAQFDLDDSGRLNEERWYSDDDSGDDWFERSTFEYTTTGLLLGQTQYTVALGEIFTTETRFAYTASGNQKSSEHYIDGEFAEGSYYDYDSADRLVREQNKEGDVTVQTIALFYDGAGALVREERDGGLARADTGTVDGTVDEITAFTYDHAGNINSTVVRLTANDQLTSQTSYDYSCWTSP